MQRLLPVLLLLLPFQPVIAYGPLLRDNAVLKRQSDTCTPCHESFIRIKDSQIGYNRSTLSGAQKASRQRSNCGSTSPCLAFDAADQYVSTTGAYAYQSPSPSDIRGLCPALNAAANHGYIPRNGLLNLSETVSGLAKAFGMASDLATWLAAYAIAFQGDLSTETWSIGGPLPADITTGTESTPEGISWSHNYLEGDSSLSRCDAYLNHGNADTLSFTRFKYAYHNGARTANYTMDRFARTFTKNTLRSVQSNPYYFAPLFSTTFFTPATYNFAITMFSNHSADAPQGYFNQRIYEIFYGVSGEYPNDLIWNPGQEHIPNNWYARPTNSPYGVSNMISDLLPTYLAYPDSFRFGCNINGVNTYQNFDIANMTNGAYSFDTLFEGDNFACFLSQSQMAYLPYQFQNQNPPPNDVAASIEFMDANWPSYFSTLNCPQNVSFDFSVFNICPGRLYLPKAPEGIPVNC